jgi:asparagine synthase (glutamine-hydrolysing)
MRLICGVLHLNGANADEDLLRAMAAQMDVPRLRPSLGFWHKGPVGLAVLDFSVRGAPAPALPESATSIIAADVRLDEPVALARALGCDEAQAEDALLLTALERFGLPKLDQVLGDFAFASWNTKAQRLICGRDMFGIRPLAFVHQPGKIFAFASFPNALHGAGIVAKKVDEDALVRRLVRNLRHDDSLIAGIRRLPPAHVIEVSSEDISLTRYWQLDRAAVGTKEGSPEAAARELRQLVDEAVRCRLPRKSETGAHLSGGLDSSAIAVLAARKLRERGRKLYAYSFLDRQRNDITLEDETEFVKAVVEQEGDIDWTPIRPSPASHRLVKPVDADKMTPLSADAPENAVCQRAEEQGVGVLLSGWGGDEGATFNGRGTLAELLLHGRWPKFAREIAALSRERGWSMASVFRREILFYFWRAVLPVSVLKRASGRDRPLIVLLEEFLSPDVRRHLTQVLDATLTMAPDGRENRWRLLTSPHIAERAEIWAQIGARHGLAFAFPLLDRRVVEFALSIRSELFLRDGFRRRPFRDAMADVLPDRVRLRHLKYRRFPSNLIDVAESKSELLARIGACEKNESVRRIINLEHLRRQVEAFPSPEHVREEMRGGDTPAAAVMMLAAMQAIGTVEYLEQHGGK